MSEKIGFMVMWRMGEIVPLNGPGHKSQAHFSLCSIGSSGSR